MTLMFKHSLLIIYILVLYGCRQDTSLKPAIQPVPDIDTVAFAEPDTEGLTKKTPQLTIPTNSRVAWQKPDLILQSFGSILQGSRIADIGAGPTGFFTFWLAQRGAFVIAIDIDPSALAYIFHIATLKNPFNYKIGLAIIVDVFKYHIPKNALVKNGFLFDSHTQIYKICRAC